MRSHQVGSLLDVLLPVAGGHLVGAGFRVLSGLRLPSDGRLGGASTRQRGNHAQLEKERNA